MLEHVDLTRKIDKEAYAKVFPEMEARLGALQRAAQQARIPVILVFEGWDTAGKGRMINRLTQVLDPRGFKVHAISAPTKWNGSILGCGASGRRSPPMGIWRFSTDLGTAACWWNGCSTSRPQPSGARPTTRSSTSSAS